MPGCPSLSAGETRSASHSLRSQRLPFLFASLLFANRLYHSALPSLPTLAALRFQLFRHSRALIPIGLHSLISFREHRLLNRIRAEIGIEPLIDQLFFCQP